MDGKKIWENVIIIVLLGTIVCFITPIIQGIFYKSQVSGAKTNADELVKTTKILYQDLSITREVKLPFTISFNEDQTYNIYENMVKIAENQKIEKAGAPTRGQIVIEKDGSVIATKITYGNIICNTDKKEEMICNRTKTGK